MTRRDLQMDLGRSGLPWEAGKAFEHSCPCGPIPPVEKAGHVLEGNFRLTVDGETRQGSNLTLMIWIVPEIISNLSKYFMPQLGDIILAGTPAGAGPVVPGNELVGSTDKLGTLTQTSSHFRIRGSRALARIAVSTFGSEALTTDCHGSISEEEHSMKALATAFVIMMCAGNAMAAEASCTAQATEKKLAGAAKTSFMTKCERDMKAACDTQASEKKLSGAAKTSFTTKCIKDSVGT
ncbi:fumarylacetoacetate hydrolase family protein [Microvirga sp. G4-2]|uniref:fumarylacetoacetate hydrolase family protein n=1 Tax=Microvirga sp. G4-2 TaxID=3434467 RepID=UPI004044BEC4